MDKEEIRRRLDKLPTADEIKAHFYAMQAEARTPRNIAQVYARFYLEHEKAEIGLTNYRRFFAGGRNWSIDDG